MRRLMSLVLVATLTMAGCAALDDGPPASPVEPPAQGETAAAIDLINLWRVSGAPGESDETWLRLDGREFQLWRECGMVMGSWTATQGLMLASVSSASGACASNGVPEIEWLSAVTGYAASEEGYDLVDAQGTIIASLRLDGAPQPIPTAAEFYTEPPEVTDEVRALFVEPSARPAELEAVAAADLEGRWTPASSQVSSDPHVEFTSDGTYSASDGCNGAGGRWAVGYDGRFLATSGVSTLVGCDGVPVPSWVAGASTVGVDDDGLLVFIDRAGTELGRLRSA